MSKAVFCKFTGSFNLDLGFRIRDVNVEIVGNLIEVWRRIGFLWRSRASWNC